jgi:hypothetical protein
MHSSWSPQASSEGWRVLGLQGTDSYSPWRAGGEDSACNELCDSDGGYQGATGGTAIGSLGSADEDHDF